MSVERGIHLDVSVPDFGQQAFTPDMHGRGDKPMHQPDDHAAERFKAAMEGTAAGAGSDAKDPAVELQRPGGLFDLFGPAHRASALPAVTAEGPHRSAGDWARQMGDSIERLMVDDGQHGSRQVRMQLKDDVLPGVTVAIQECDGRLQVDFVCSVEASRLRLNEEASSHARTLADRLQRDVLVRVQTDDDEDPCLLETLACP